MVRFVLFFFPTDPLVFPYGPVLGQRPLYGGPPIALLLFIGDNVDHCRSSHRCHFSHCDLTNDCYILLPS